MTTPSTIGRGTTIRGSVRSDGDLDIHGFVEGSVNVKGELVIAETALIKSDVSGRRVIVRGVVAGNVSADELIIVEAGARIVGDIGAPQIGIRPGGLIRGHVATGAPLPARAPQAAAAPAQAAKGRPAAAAPVAAAAAPAPAPRQTAPATAARVPATPATPARAPAPPAAKPTPTPAAKPAPAAARAPTPAPVVVRAPIPAPAPTPIPVAAPPPQTEATHEPDLEDEHVMAEVSTDEPTELVAAEADSSGPPPPVVPAVPKGAKAQVRRGRGGK